MLTGSKINKVKTPQVETALPAMLPSPAQAAVHHHVGPVAGPWKWARRKETGAGFVLMVMLGPLPGLLWKGVPQRYRWRRDLQEHPLLRAFFSTLSSS